MAKELIKLEEKKSLKPGAIRLCSLGICSLTPGHLSAIVHNPIEPRNPNKRKK
jgi:hypothetical protein